MGPQPLPREVRTLAAIGLAGECASDLPPAGALRRFRGCGTAPVGAGLAWRGGAGPAGGPGVRLEALWVPVG